MMVPRVVRLILTLSLIASSLVILNVLAQETMSSTIVASGLTSPRDFIVGTNGNILVALAGSGGSQKATESAPTTEQVGPWTGGPTGAVATIGAGGCPVLLAGGLPSAVDRNGNVLGAEDLAVLDGQLYVAVDGGGAVHGNPESPSGVYIVYGDGSTRLIADLSSWVRQNPVAELPEDHDPDAAGYSMVADQDRGLLWVSDPSSGQILTVTADGAVSRVADLSSGREMPTRLALNPEGGVYIGTMPTAPYTDGAAKVMAVSPDGAVTDVWTGLTAVADVAVDTDGTLYALEMSTGNQDEAPYLVKGSGRLVRQAGFDELEVVEDGLMYPVAMEIGPDGAFYVSMPAIGASEGEGVIQRIALDGSEPDIAASSDCAPLPETLSADTGMAVSISPTGEQVTEPVPTIAAPASTPAETAAVAPGMLPNEVHIAVLDLTFQPGTIQIPAGTTVRWTNMDDVEHTATGVNWEFDSGIIAPGGIASITFDTPGTYVYFCQIHPDMRATIVVV